MPDTFCGRAVATTRAKPLRPPERAYASGNPSHSAQADGTAASHAAISAGVFTREYANTVRRQPAQADLPPELVTTYLLS